MSVPKYKFPTALRATRERIGISQRELSAAISCDQAYLCALEKGRKVAPNPAVVRKIASAFRLSPPESMELLGLAEHDRLLKAVLPLVPADKAAFIVSAIESLYLLDSKELFALTSRIQEIATSKRQLLALMQSV